MPLVMRPAGRFFAAFYRWSCSTQQATCRHVPRSNTPRNYKSYSGTRWLQRDNAIGSGVPTHMKPHQTMKTAIRNLMRHVPSSVSIITVRAAQPGHDQLLPIGSAISSLTTVTLDPPHISFNIKTPSRTLSAVHEAGGRFRVHFLDDSIAAAELAHNFTQGNAEHVLAKRAQLFGSLFDPAISPTSAPRTVSDAVVASMDCQLLQEVPVADHVVAIAKVAGFRSRDELRPTLLYNEGRYKRNNGTALLDPRHPVGMTGDSGAVSAGKVSSATKPSNDEAESSLPNRGMAQASQSDTAI